MNTLKFVGHKTLMFWFKDLAFFNGIMGLISLAQAIRIWMPDDMFLVVGYEPMHKLFNENVFAVIPFAHWAGCTFRYFTEDFFLGRTWFWRVGQATHLFGAFAYAAPALSIAVSLHTLGLQTVGFLIISFVMVWQVLRTDV